MPFPETYQDREQYFISTGEQIDVMTETYQGRVIYPMGLGSFVVPIIEYGDQVLGPLQAYSTANVVVKVDLPSPILGVYDSGPNTIHLNVYTFDAGEIPSGVESIMLRAMDTDPHASQGLLDHLPPVIPTYFREDLDTFDKNQHPIYWRIVIKDWLSGINERRSWGIPEKDRREAIGSLKPWLERYIIPTDNDIRVYGGTYIHERHHELMVFFSLQKGIYQTRDQHVRAVDFFTNPQLCGTQDEFIDLVESSVDIEAFGRLSQVDQLQHLHGIYYRALKQKGNSDWENLLRVSINRGAGEIIGHLISQLSSLYVHGRFHPWDVAFRYDMRSHFFPSQSIIDRWEDILTCDISDLGKSLTSVYDDYFKGGVFEELYERALANVDRVL